MCIDLKNSYGRRSTSSGSKATTLCLTVIALALMLWVVSLIPAAIDQQFSCAPSGVQQSPALSEGHVYHQGTHWMAFVGEDQ